MEPTHDVTPGQAGSVASAPGGELVVQNGRLAGIRRPLGLPLTFLGRAPTCDVRLNVDGIAPLHCLIVHGPAGVLLRDLDSEQGTLVNGRRVRSCPLHDGDIIVLGPFQFRIQLPSITDTACRLADELPADEKEALRIQAAAVAAQQAALAEEEERLRQRRSTLEQQEGQLAAHLEEKRRRLVQLTQQAQSARTSLQKERADYNLYIQTITSDLGQAQRELLQSQQKTHEERQRLSQLRRRMKQRWHRHWAAERNALCCKEDELAAERRKLQKDGERLQHERALLTQARLRFNGEAELGKRQLQADRELLREQQLRWQDQRTREQAELERRARALGERESALADNERALDDDKYSWEKTRALLLREAEGLDTRVRNQRRKILEQQQEIQQLEARLRSLQTPLTPNPSPPGGEGSNALPSVADPVPAPPPEPQHEVGEAEHAIDRRARALARFAEELADQRLLLMEQWERLARLHQGWHEERVAAQDQLEALIGDLPEREEALEARLNGIEAAEADLRRRHQDALQLRHHLEGWSARVRLREADCEGERDRLLLDVRGREEVVEKQLATLAEMRQNWARRRRHELEVVRAERAACERLRQECAALRERLWRSGNTLEEERRALAEKTLALEQYHQQYVVCSADAVTAERRVARLRRKWVAQNADAVRATTAERQALRQEIARLEDGQIALQRQMEELTTRESSLAQRQTAWEEAQAQAEWRQERLRQQLQSMQGQRDRHALQVRELQDEVERIARLLLDEPELPIPARSPGSPPMLSPKKSAFPPRISYACSDPPQAPPCAVVRSPPGMAERPGSAPQTGPKGPLARSQTSRAHSPPAAVPFRATARACGDHASLRVPRMPKVPSVNLIDVLRRQRLLSEEQLASLNQFVKGRHADARLLARTLVQRGWLTVYQVNQILAGHGGDLVLGPYHILDRVGQGGQSQVFKARHREHDWLVALKVIRSELFDNPESRRQFLQEMEAMASLDHPHVIQFLDADECSDTFYCAMEFAEGTDLGKLVRLCGLLPPEVASEYVRQAALGLQHAHERNLIHRDIKPVNLMLTNPAPEPAELGPQNVPSPAPLIKILDWGLASLRPPARHTPSSIARAGGAILGTADYLSPEQARNAGAADIRSDIYSLGCTFYYLLTGQPPFPGNSLAGKLIQHQTGEPEPVDRFNPEMTPGLAAILKRMMAKNPDERYQTPAALALALKPFCRKPAGAPAVTRAPLTPRPADPAPRVADDTPLPTTLAAEELPEASDSHPNLFWPDLAPRSGEVRRP
ncbi:MAG: protein kinase [Gemmataceae bacterium]|nr:protein kinase [Gemmataceae bacterium]